MNMMVISTVAGALRTLTKVKGLEDLETTRDYPDNSIIMIG